MALIRSKKFFCLVHDSINDNLSAVGRHEAEGEIIAKIAQKETVAIWKIYIHIEGPIVFVVKIHGFSVALVERFCLILFTRIKVIGIDAYTDIIIIVCIDGEIDAVGCCQF